MPSAMQQRGNGHRGRSREIMELGGAEGKTDQHNRRAHKWRPYVPSPSSSGPVFGGIGHGTGNSGSRGVTKGFWHRILTTQPPPHTPTWVPVYPDPVSTPPTPLSTHNSHQRLIRPESLPNPQPIIPPPPPHPSAPNSRPTYPFLPHIPKTNPQNRAYGRSHNLVGGSRGGERTSIDVEERSKVGDIGETTVREVYEKTLRVLCKWIPNLLRNVTFEGCIESGKKAARWMSPFASTYAENFRSTSRQQHFTSRVTPQEDEDRAAMTQSHLRRLRPSRPSSTAEGMWPPPFDHEEGEYPSNMLRPILKPRAPAPWYNYRWVDTFAGHWPRQ